LEPRIIRAKSCCCTIPELNVSWFSQHERVNFHYIVSPSSFFYLLCSATKKSTIFIPYRFSQGKDHFFLWTWVKSPCFLNNYDDSSCKAIRRIYIVVCAPTINICHLTVLTVYYPLPSICQQLQFQLKSVFLCNCNGSGHGPDF
jgi:hypothetical protein